MKGKLSILLLLFWAIMYINAQNDSAKVYLSGQVSLGANLLLEKPIQWQVGGIFTPALLGKFTLSSNTTLDFEASVTSNGSIAFTHLNKDTLIGDIRPYRVWTRFSGDNWEVRAGLQKINFGSAKLFRPLMWFDATDVRDPLKMTDGVYGVLGKYFFQNNANIWLWGLVGNKKPKAYELWGTSAWKPEVGGRFESPLGPGEIGLSTHFRTIQYRNIISSIAQNYETKESRIGLDGKWDVGVGLWFESSVTVTNTKQQTLPLFFKVQDLWNLGADYTLPIGSGLGVTFEYFRYHAGNEFLIQGNTMNVLGSMLTYPISLLDNLSGMVFYLPDQHKWMNYFSWTRTYDKWNLYAIAYWNPTDLVLAGQAAQSRNLFAGKGLQVMLNYNF